MHDLRLVALDEQRGVQPQPRRTSPVPRARYGARIVGLLILKPLRCRIGSNCAVGDRVEKLVGLARPSPTASVSSSLSAPTMQATIRAGLLERRAEGVAEETAEFAAFVNGARRRGGHVAIFEIPPGNEKLLEQPLHSGFVLADVGIDLAVGLPSR